MKILVRKSFTKRQNKVKLIKLTNFFARLMGLSTLLVGLSYNQTPVRGQVCYAQKEDGSILDLSYLCQEKPIYKEATSFTSLPIEQQKAILAALSKELNQACNQLPGKCESNVELINTMKKMCSRPGHCPNYLNEILQNYPLK
ncbi:MAG: hypothetical protein U7123_14950 [Potamolinea sp.]